MVATPRPRTSPPIPWFAEELDALQRRAVGAAAPAFRDEARALLEAVVRNAPEPILVVTVDGRYLFLNRERDDVAPLREGSSIWDHLSPADHARVRACLDEVVRTKHPGLYEAAITIDDGSVLHFETRVGPIVEGDEVVALALVATDVTERRERALALQRSEERLRFAIEASGMAVWSFHADRERIELDPQLASWAGVTPGAHPIADLAARVPPPDRRAITQALHRCVETGVDPDLEHRVLRPDGSVLWLHSKGRAVRDDRGLVTHVVGGSFDVTAQVEEAQRRERAQKLEAVGQLAAGIAHNFNNALASMQLNLEFALRRTPEDVRPILIDALEAGHRATDLVRELLRFAGRGGRGDLRELESLDEIALRVVSLCRHTFPDDIVIETRCAPGVPLMPLAVAQVEQLALNLLINAQHALEEVERERRWVLVAVDVLAGDAPEVQRDDIPAAPSFVRLRVEDNGCGMSDETMARVFEPFFTTKIPGRGTGLGLATAWSAARDHGGWLQCTSRVAVGSTFSVYFPVRGRAVEAGPGAG